MRGAGRAREKVKECAGESSRADKRDSARIALDGRIQGEVMVFQPMTVLDISRGGAQIETAFALSAGSLHDFRLSLGDRAIVVRGRIAYCQIGELTDVSASYRSGVTFVELTSQDGSALDGFVEASGDL